jgi:hypothetical protein
MGQTADSSSQAALAGSQAAASDLNATGPSTAEPGTAAANSLPEGNFFQRLGSFYRKKLEWNAAKYHMATEAWYMYERHVPNVVGDVTNPISTEIVANGAFCLAGQQTCTAPEYAVVNYINREINSKLMIGFRSDFLDDKKG